MPKLLDQFTKDIKLLYGNVYVYRDVDRVQVKIKRIFQEMSILGCAGSKEWKIPKFIINVSILRKVWLQAFYDDEGYVGENRVVVSSINKKGLKSVKIMLNKEGIQVNMRGPYFNKLSKTPFFVLHIPKKDMKQFYENIGFFHPIKKMKLETFISKKLIMRQGGISG